MTTTHTSISSAGKPDRDCQRAAAGTEAWRCVGPNRAATPFSTTTSALSIIGHIIHAADVVYLNSDGSSSDRNLGKMVTPEIVLAKFVHDVVMHGRDEEH
eukprot:m.157309 g.157309  ORF g.157309 m.157309 type:complete len:100 (-) comp14461_c0_seq2:76-375(-)